MKSQVSCGPARGLPAPTRSKNVTTAHPGDPMNLPPIRSPRNASNWIALLSTLAVALLVLGA